jgi:phage terminase small subunit
VIVNPEGLNDRQSRFVEDYMVDLNATQAAIRAGYSADTAQEQSSRLLSNVMVQRAIAAERIKQQERTQISADRVVLEAWNQVTADARELTSLVYHACRHCHGIGHHFHWRDEEEFAQAVDKAVSDNALREPAEPPIPIPVNLGGFGYSRRLEPNPACPKCDGDGLMDVRIGDTRKLSPAALSLFAGIKQTKFGIEVQMHSKDAAMEKLFKHLGLYEQDNRQKADPLTSLLTAITQGSGNGFKPVSEDPEHKEG